MKTIVRIVHKITDILSWVSGIILFLMAAMMTVHVVGRYVFHAPIPGAQELVQMSLVLIVYCGMPFASYKRRHLSVDAVTRVLKPIPQNILAFIMELLCIAVAVLLALKLGEQANAYFISRATQTTMALKLPYFIFYYFAAFLSWWLCLEFLLDAISRLKEVVQRIKGTYVCLEEGSPVETEPLGNKEKEGE